MPLESGSKRCTSLLVDHDGLSFIETGFGAEQVRGSAFDDSPRNGSPIHAENVH